MRQTRLVRPHNRTHSARPAHGLFAMMLVIAAGAASCATQGYYESQVAARTAYEAAESAKAAAYASTVAAIDMHEANLRATRAMNELTSVLSGPAPRTSGTSGDAPPPRTAPSVDPGGATPIPPAPAPTDTHAPSMTVTPSERAQEPLANMQTIKVLAPAVIDDAPSAPSAASEPSSEQEVSGVLPLLRQNNATLERVIASQDRLARAADAIGAATEKIVAQTDKVAASTDSLIASTDRLVASTDRLVASTDKIMGKADRLAMSADVLSSRLTEERERPPSPVIPAVETREESNRTLALAFASFAIVAMLGVGWWTERTRRASRDARDWGDWLLVSSASGAAVTSIGLIGALYFAVRIFQGKPHESPLWNLPWQTMAWLWASMVIVGLIGMWIMAIIAFWSRLADVDHSRRAKDAVVEVPSARHEMWRLWIAVLLVGLVPALGMLAMARADLLLDMLLVLVFAVFAGAAVLLSGREEVASRPARHAST